MSRRAFYLLALSTIICVVFFRVIEEARAGALNRMTDVLNRQTVSTPANHTITFVTPTGVDASGDTITISFAPQFQFSTFAIANFDLAVDNNSACDGPWTDREIALDAGLDVWGVVRSGSVITLTAPTNSAGSGGIAPNRCVQIEIGSNATFGGTGSPYLTNPSTPNAYRIDFAGTFSDSGFLWVPIVSNDSVQVSATVPSPTPPTLPDTVVVFRGIAYPRSQVTFERQGTILATVPADPTARFDVTFGSQPAGTWTYAVYAEDNQGRVGRTSNFTLAITSGTTTTVSGIFLGPTIAADQTSIELSETVTILGATLPSATITVYVSSEEEVTFQTTADAEGLWTRQFLGSDVGLGDHNIRSKAVSAASEISAFSNTIPLTVTETSSEPPGPPDECDGKNRADINCDGSVNLTDFSILLFYWQQTNPDNTRTDINGDSRVGLIDFSILLFNWTP